MRRKQEGICPICGCEIEAFTSAYRSHPFIDGRCYNEICWTCANVPKTHTTEEDRMVVFNVFQERMLHSVQEMMDDGFTRHEAEISIKWIKRALRKRKQCDLPLTINHCLTIPV